MLRNLMKIDRWGINSARDWLITELGDDAMANSSIQLWLIEERVPIHYRLTDYIRICIHRRDSVEIISQKNAKMSEQFSHSDIMRILCHFWAHFWIQVIFLIFFRGTKNLEYFKEKWYFLICPLKKCQKIDSNSKMGPKMTENYHNANIPKCLIKNLMELRLRMLSKKITGSDSLPVIW